MIVTLSLIDPQRYSQLKTPSLLLETHGVTYKKCTNRDNSAELTMTLFKNLWDLSGVPLYINEVLGKSWGPPKSHDLPTLEDIFQVPNSK